MAERVVCPHCDAATKANPNHFHMEAGVSMGNAPFVHLAWRKERQQLTPEEARDLAASLVQIAGVAEYEAAFTRWLQAKMQLTQAQAAVMLAEVRDYFAQAEEITAGRTPRQPS